MTVAELAKRFEEGRVSETTPDAPGRPRVAGRVRELTRRLEEAVIDNGTAGTAFGAPQENTRSPPPRPPVGQSEQPARSSPRPAPAASVPASPKKQSPAAVFPSPPPLPRVARALPDTLASPSLAPRVSPSSPLSQGTASVPSIEQLSSAKIPDASKNIHPPPLPSSTQDAAPQQISLSERLAAYERLTTAEPFPIPDGPPTTPSTPFSSNSSVLSSQEPIDLIPDVSEGDLDDIEGVERVDDEGSINSTPSDDENATFRRAKTVQTLSTSDSQSSHHLSEPPDPPSNPSTPSNASENSSFSAAEFASATEEFQGDRPAPHTVSAPPRTAPRHSSNLSAQPHTLHIAPGSFKNLPKAKVMIARRRGHEEEKDEPGASNDDVSTRKLIREYEHPNELLKGSVSLVELSDEDEETVEFRDPEVSDARRETAMMQRKKSRAEAFRHRYDECMDPQEIERKNERPVEEENAASSKERYQRRRLFRRGKVEKARQREERHARQRDAVTRRSAVISGAIDRVSLAADPWIDFITDTNTLPVTQAGGGLRRGLKRLFGFGRQNAGLIKTGK